MARTRQAQGDSISISWYENLSNFFLKLKMGISEMYCNTMDFFNCVTFVSREAAPAPPRRAPGLMFISTVSSAVLLTA